MVLSCRCATLGCQSVILRQNAVLQVNFAHYALVIIPKHTPTPRHDLPSLSTALNSLAYTFKNSSPPGEIHTLGYAEGPGKLRNLCGVVYNLAHMWPGCIILSSLQTVDLSAAVCFAECCGCSQERLQRSTTSSCPTTSGRKNCL